MNQKPRSLKHLNILIICFIGSTFSFLGYLNSTQLERQQQQASVTKLIYERQAQLETRIAATVEILDTLGSFISHTELLSPQAYASFTQPILDRHPEFWALHWTPRIKHRERANFERLLAERGFNNRITELEPSTNSISLSSIQEEYYPVLLTEPLQHNRAIIGFNVNSRQINSDVISQTLNHNINFLSSAPFKLVQDNEGSASVVFFRPVFSRGPAPSDLEERQESIKGYILALVKPQTLLDMLAKSDEGIATQLRDITGDQAINIGHSGQEDADIDWLTQQVQFASLGREWQLELSISAKHPLLMDGTSRALWILIGGLSFTFVLATILFRLSQAHHQTTQERDRAQSYLDTVETIMMVLDQQGCVTMINRKGCEILGYSEAEIIGSLWFSPRYMPETEERYREHLACIKRSTLSDEMAYTESPVLDKRGNTLLIAWHNKIQFDNDGRPSGILSAGEDITQKHYFSSLDQIRSKAMQSALEGTPLNKTLDLVLKGIESINPGTKCSILLLDKSGKHLMGCSAPSLPEAYNQIIDGIEIGDGIGSCGTAAFRQERVIVEDIQEHPYWAAFKELAAGYDLGSCWSEPIFGKKGRLLGTFAIYHAKACSPINRDLSLIEKTADFVSLLIEEQQTEADLQRMATTDELTSLPNRRKFLSTLEAELLRAKRYGRPLSLCMLDLDHFKRINDSYGHHVGDNVLKHVATIMTSILRETDMAGRLGGEEFGILLPDTQEDQAIIMAERLRWAIEDTGINQQSETLKITASIGVTSLKNQTELTQSSELLSAADCCLYHAKKNGRNQVSNIPIEHGNKA
jgi:diguanylate cyclase (GGDEF)-like protein/PAS domain S-box-containing protein